MHINTNAENLVKLTYFIQFQLLKLFASEIGLDAVSIASALIHDVVEDNSNHTLQKILKKNLGKIFQK